MNELGPFITHFEERADGTLTGRMGVYNIAVNWAGWIVPDPWQAAHLTALHIMVWWGIAPQSEFQRYFDRYVKEHA